MASRKTAGFAISAALYEDVVTVRDFVRDSVRGVVDRFANEDTVHALFLRGQGWLNTLGELKEPQHFQAALAGTRALFELAVDLGVLHHDRKNFPVEHVAIWERSQKLLAAERVERAFKGKALTSDLQMRVDFVRREGPAIRAERARIWGPAQTKHPSRWTNRSLDADALAVDAFGTYGLREYYDVRYPELCWGAHASGITIVRGVDEETFAALIGLAFKDAAHMGVLVARFALLYFDKLDTIVEQRFQKLENDRRKWTAVGWANATGRVSAPRAKRDAGS
jgi:hypothetical protein